MGQNSESEKPLDLLTALRELQETVRQKRMKIMKTINNDEHECSARKRERLLKLASQLARIEMEAKEREVKLSR